MQSGFDKVRRQYMWLLLSQVYSSSISLVCSLVDHSISYRAIRYTLVITNQHTNIANGRHPRLHSSYISLVVSLLLHVDDIVASLLLFLCKSTQGR